MEAIFQRSDDSEITAAAAYSPKQIGVLCGTRRMQFPIRCDHVRTDDVIDRESIFGVQVPPSSAQTSGLRYP